MADTCFSIPVATQRFRTASKSEAPHCSHLLSCTRKARCAATVQHKQQLKRSRELQTALAASSATSLLRQAHSQSATNLQLPAALSKHTAQLTITRNNKSVHVYVLGMSHVSRQSCNHTAQLIAAATPDIVLLELCKDRVGLLIDPSLPQPQYWHSRNIKLESSTAQQPTPVQHAFSSLMGRLQCQPGRAFSAFQIEQDCIQLLSSGLFKSVVPVTETASDTDAPMFVYTNNQKSSTKTHAPATACSDVKLRFLLKQQPKGASCMQMMTVAPLGSLTFRVTFRAIPTVNTVKLQNSPERYQADLSSIVLQMEEQQHQSVLHKLADLHEHLQAAMPTPAAVCFDGIESGKINVLVTATESQAEASLTGLESSAKSGKGWGIQPFQRRAQEVPSLQPASAQTPSVSRSTARLTEVHPGSEQDMQQGAGSTSGQTQPQLSNIANRFAEFLTTRYGGYQAEAGRKVGVQAGEAWRGALLAAAQQGVSQVQLFDKPAVAMSQQMADAIWQNTLPYLAGALALGFAGLAGAASHSPLTWCNVAAAGLLARAVLPVAKPLWEVQKLSKLSRDELEAAVDPGENLQDSTQAVKLWGEDALLDWPGAMQPVIHDRDAHMAQAIWAAAHGTAGSPTYAITNDQAGTQTWQYLMPNQAVDSAACPAGHGNGTFKPSADVQSIVAVVGTAHVYGIMKHLKKLQDQRN